MFWWKRRSGGAKTVVVLAVLLILQIGLCFSTDSTVLPAYVAIFGHGSESELGLSLVVFQAILCAVTIVALLIAAIAVGAGGGFAAKGDSKGDSDD
jgi:4-amino-4-deoxy-L-arabinose transferase-like glycosyltransferase